MPRTSVFVIAAAAAATCALAACGPVKMGSAAITGGQRLTVTTLSGQVTDLENAVQAGRGKIQLQFPQSQAPQAVLGWLLRFRIRDELAARNHVAVTAGEGQRALATLARQTGRSGPAFVQLAVANGIAPDMLPELGRYEAIQQEMFIRLNGGTLPRSQTQAQVLSVQFNHRECVAAKSLNIQVNPQYGQLDYGTYSVIPVPSTLSAPTTPSPSPTPKPKLAPAC
ncbi:MAG: hypothetical protein J2P30_13910 [Actinobacteria bacterium]|nr:hypothetical protein [Actinomycetota bacterium]